MEGVGDYDGQGRQVLARRWRVVAATLFVTVLLTAGESRKVARAQTGPDIGVTIDADGSGVTTTIEVPGMQGDGSGNYGTDQGVNLDPCWWVIDPSGMAVELFDGVVPTDAQVANPGVTWYMQYCDADASGSALTTRGANWVLNGNAGPPSQPPPPPAALAGLAVKYMPIPAPDVRTNPSPAALVNLPTWLWLDNSSWSVPPGRLSLRGVSVTVIATPKYVDWNTGAGTKRCNGQGQAYDRSSPSQGQSTYCSWTYRTSSAGQPGSAYQGTASTRWGIHWISTGVLGNDQGDLPDLVRSTPFSLRVDEIQTVVTK
jgi:hypothetical protein